MPATASLVVRMEPAAKKTLARAAKLRGVSLSDYVRQTTFAQARREIDAETDRVLVLSPEDQLAFWKALSAPVKLTPAQKKLGKIMRGEA